MICLRSRLHAFQYLHVLCRCGTTPVALLQLLCPEILPISSVFTITGWTLGIDLHRCSDGRGAPMILSEIWHRGEQWASEPWAAFGSQCKSAGRMESVRGFGLCRSLLIFLRCPTSGYWGALAVCVWKKTGPLACALFKLIIARQASSDVLLCLSFLFHLLIWNNWPWSTLYLQMSCFVKIIIHFTL
jgi:hypothetical protein